MSDSTPTGPDPAKTDASAQLAEAARIKAADDAAIAAAFSGEDPSAQQSAQQHVNAGAQQQPAQRNLRVDEPGGIRDDDFGLNGDMATVLADALAERFPETNADTDTPDPASPSAPHAEDGAGGGGAGEQDAAPGSSAASAPAPSDFSLDAYARDYFGTDLTREEAQALFGVLGGLQTATPEMRQYIDGVLTGRIAPTPGGPPTTQVPGQQQLPVAPDPTLQAPAQSTLPPRPDDEYQAQIYDSLIVPLATQQQQLAQQQAALQAEIARNTEAQLAQQRAQDAERINTTANAWREQNKLLSDGEFDAITQGIARSGVFPALIQAHHGNIEAAVTAAYEQAFWGDPTLRQKAIANIASGRQPLDPTTPDPTSQVAADQQQLDQGRRALASSVAGGGGQQPNRNPAPPATPEGRRGAMVAEIAAAMAAGAEITQ